MKSDTWIKYMGMEERKSEGGYVSLAYRSDTFVPEDALKSGQQGERVSASMIYYALGEKDISCWHIVRSDEIWIWRDGGALEITLGGFDESPKEERKVILGNNLEAGELPHYVVKAGEWQTSRPLTKDGAVVNCIVTPGFEEQDFIKEEV